MRTRFLGATAALLAMAGCAADAGDIADDAPVDTVSSAATSVVSPEGCPGIRATLDEHVAAGRVITKVTQFFIFTVKQYYLPIALTPPVGTDGSAMLTLYQDSLERWVNTTTNCRKCGNGIREESGGERCDGTDLGSSTCQSFGFSSGSLSCDATCHLDATACTSSTTCGNGIIESTGVGEQCDGTNLGENPTCAAYGRGYSGGTIRCTSGCQLDISGCTKACGNGVIDPGEQCDGTALSAEFAGKACRDIRYGYTWPFNVPINYPSGNLTCSAACTITYGSCTLPNGCFYVPVSTASPAFVYCQ